MLEQFYSKTTVTQVHNITHSHVRFATRSATFEIIHTGKKHQLYQEQFLLKTYEDTKKKEHKRKQLKLQQCAGRMDVVVKFHEVMKPIIEEKKKQTKIILQGQIIAQHQYPNTKIQISQKNNGNNIIEKYAKPQSPFVIDQAKTPQIRTDFPKGSYIPGLLNVSNGIARFINVHLQIQQSIPEAVLGSIVFAAEQNVEYFDTERKDEQQLMYELERFVVDRTDDNRNEDQSEHAIEPMHFTNGNYGLRRKDRATQLQVTIIVESKYKNLKWQSKLTIQKPFIFRDWREFWSHAGFSLEQINIP
ncbi:MAG: hypothetical protein EZS28_039969, partial [Streblomastix strix]